jgi:DNA-binding transcriptional MocR family regulator
VGPTAWAALADLCLDARPDAGGVVVVVASARQVAANVGVGKDTAARALRRLAAAGVLRRRPQATDDAGRFGCCTYELDMEFRPGAPRPPNPDTEPDPCPVQGDADDNSHPSINDRTREAAGALAAGSRRASPRPDSRGRHRGTGNQLSLLDGCDNAQIGLP